MSEPTGDPLLALALADPDRAACVATTAIEAGGLDAIELSYAHQALGIVLRDRGDIDLALTHLRTARRLAQGADRDRSADVRATLGAALALRGRSVAAVRELDAAVETASARGPVRAKALLRRAHVFSTLGRHPEAIADLHLAVPAFRRSGDEVWEARALNVRAHVEILRAEFADAERDLHEADLLFTRQGHVELLYVRHNLALIRFFRGDVPTALAAFAELSDLFTTRGLPQLDLALDQARVLLAAGLSDEAVVVIESASDWSSTRPRARAELLVMRASARLGQGRAEDALADAADAHLLFARQQREWWGGRADLVALRARIELGRGSRRRPSRWPTRWPTTTPRTASWRRSRPGASSPPRTP